MASDGSRAGFSLIETAIVLAIAGLVIGGLWFAYKDVMYRYNLDETNKGIKQAISSIRRLYSSTPCDTSSTYSIDLKSNNLGTLSSWPAAGSNYSVKSPYGPTVWFQVFCGSSYGPAIISAFSYQTKTECDAISNELRKSSDLIGYLGCPVGPSQVGVYFSYR